MAGSVRIRLLSALALALAAAAGVFALTAAGGAAADDGVLDIQMLDGSVGLERATLAAGRVVLDVTNAGTQEHEVVVIRTGKPADRLPVGLHGVSISLAGELLVGEDHIKAKHGHRPGQILGLQPGESQRFQADLKPGNYVVYCQTGSHYLSGERAALVVE